MKQKTLFLFLAFFCNLVVFSNTTSEEFLHQIESKKYKTVYPYINFYSRITKRKTLEESYKAVDLKLKDGRAKLLNELAYISATISRSGTEKAFIMLQQISKGIHKQDVYVKGVYKFVFAKLLFNVDKTKLALKTNLESIQIFHKLNQKVDLKRSYINQGFYNAMISGDESLKWYNKALALEKEGILDGQALLQMDFAFAEVLEKDFDKAIEYCNIALKKIKSEKENDFKNEFRVLTLMSSIYYYDDRQKSVDCLQKAKEIAIKYEMLESLEEINYAQSTEFFLNKDYKNAFNRLKEADSLRKILEFDKIREEVAVYDLEHKISEEKKEKKRVQEIVRIQARQKQILIISLSIITITLLGISRLLLKIRTKNKVLVQQNLKLANAEVKRVSTAPTAGTENKDISLELICELEKLIYDKKLYEKSNLTIDKLAKRLNTNRTYLSEAINTYYKENYSSWINEIRINASLKMLASPDYDQYSIEGIANMVGYSTISSFNASFKKITGLTPTQFKKTR